MTTENNTFANPTYTALRASKIGQGLIAKSEAEAASFVFDLDSGERNPELKAQFSDHEIYMMVTTASSTTFTGPDGVTYEAHPYYSELSEEVVLELLQDVQVRIETSLLQTLLEYGISEEIS